MQLHELKGTRFGRLTVIARGKKMGKQRGWVCQCDCTEIVEVAGNHLVSGDTQSCGCLRSEVMTRQSKARLHLKNRGRFAYRSTSITSSRNMPVNMNDFDELGS